MSMELKTLIGELLDGIALASLLSGWILLGIVMLFQAWERYHGAINQKAPRQHQS